MSERDQALMVARDAMLDGNWPAVWAICRSHRLHVVFVYEQQHNYVAPSIVPVPDGQPNWMDRVFPELAAGT